MQVCTVQRPPKHLFFCTKALFCVLGLFFSQPITFLRFLSKDIHQRNIAPPSLVTPAALCQLSEPESTDCCCRWRCWGDKAYEQYPPALLIFTPHQKVWLLFLIKPINIHRMDKIPWQNILCISRKREWHSSLSSLRVKDHDFGFIIPSHCGQLFTKADQSNHIHLCGLSNTLPAQLFKLTTV